MDQTAPLLAETLPRYLEIQRDLQERISSGDWGPGSRVPPEHELQSQYACSRMTVNKALSALAGAGLIVRKRRSGSFVAAPKSQQTILKIHDIKAEILGNGQSYRFNILRRDERRASAEDATRLDIRAGTPVLSLQLLHFAGDKPFVHEERLLNLAVVADAAAEDFRETPPGSWLLTVVPWTDAEHIIRAETAGIGIARMLEIDKSAACLVVERRTWQVGATVTWVKLTYPGARHQFTSHFSPGDRLGM